ncbi:hypothetical protein B0H14DRAFT_3449078 [Mycena olivaceomarginata]|nr:hypothetical protein B0H14DRAFT_3449078 [Mycena olivaceomarginata]
MPVVFRTTSITASRPRAPTRRISLLSLASSIASSSSSICSTSSENTTITPIIVTTTTFTTRVTYPATVPPPFTTSRGSDDVLPRPRRGAPPVLPPKSVEERLKAQRRLEKKSALRRAFGLRPTRARLDPALCEGWWYALLFCPVALGLILVLLLDLPLRDMHQMAPALTHLMAPRVVFLAKETSVLQ